MIDLLCDKNVLLELPVLSYKHENMKTKVWIIHSYHLQFINCQLFLKNFLTLCGFQVIVDK